MTLRDAIEVPGRTLASLIDSRWPFTEQCDRLKAAKEYRA
jgi:hypothetical protein